VQEQAAPSRGQAEFIPAIRVMIKSLSYAIVSPARDEAEYIKSTIESVVTQSIRPAKWVIIDDGSTDATGAIIDRYAAQYPWISPVHQANRGHRDADRGAIGAFLTGYQALKTTDWEFLVNLDADLWLEPDYFERCFEEFRKDPRLGIGGGTLYHHDRVGREVIEHGPSLHVRGATKIYRRDCWNAIGGLGDEPGWDTLDEVKANLAGWRTRSFREIGALHQRPTGAAGGSWRDSVKNGRSDYYLGYHPLFALVKCLIRVFGAPYVVDGAGHFYGFMSGYINRRPQVDNKNLMRYLRNQQLRRLLFLDSAWK
jgi:biofilm PGA synthesis N-glycosyltransferase PgaC